MEKRPRRRTGAREAGRTLGDLQTDSPSIRHSGRPL